jgi:hypothetical protein
LEITKKAPLYVSERSALFQATPFVYHEHYNATVYDDAARRVDVYGGIQGYLAYFHAANDDGEDRTPLLHVPEPHIRQR